MNLFKINLQILHCPVVDIQQKKHINEMFLKISNQCSVEALHLFMLENKQDASKWDGPVLFYRITGRGKSTRIHCGFKIIPAELQECRATTEPPSLLTLMRAYSGRKRNTWKEKILLTQTSLQSAATIHRDLKPSIIAFSNETTLKIKEVNMRKMKKDIY